MARTTANSLEELYAMLRKLEAAHSEIVSVKKDNCGGYIVRSLTSGEAAENKIQADYDRLRRMERRINVYPDLRAAVRAAVEHNDGAIDRYLARFRQALQGTRQHSRQAQEPPPCLP